MWYRVAGIVWLLLLAGVICNRESYRVKFFLREMANISPYQKTFRKHSLNMSFLLSGLYMYLEKMLNQFINTKAINEAIWTKPLFFC